MFCNYCGKEINDDAKFCPFCGASFGLIDEEKSDNKKSVNQQKGNHIEKSGKRSKKKIIAILIVVLVVVCVGGGTTIVFASPAHQMSNRLKKEDYENALSIYNTDIKDSFIQTWIADRFLLGTVSDIVEKYGVDEVSYEEALDYLETISKMGALESSEEAAIQIENLETLYASGQAYELGESYYAAGEYDSALSAYQQVDESDTEHYEDAQSKIESATENYREQIMEKVGSPSTVEEYETAISLLNTALSVLPDDEELASLLDTCETELIGVVKESALTEATDAIAEGDYESAFEILETALTYVPDDTDLLNLVSSAQSQYEDYITAEVKEMTDDNDYDNALDVLEQALKVFPDSTVLQELYDKTNENQPEKLNALVISDSSDYYQGIIDAEDTVGNVYHSSNMYEIWYHNGVIVDEPQGYSKYYLDNKYTTLEFTLAVSSEDYTDGCSLTIYGDDEEVLYTSGELGRTTAPQTVSVDVSNVKWLTFEANCSVIYNGTTSVHLLVVDPVLYKN